MNIRKAVPLTIFVVFAAVFSIISLNAHGQDNSPESRLENVFRDLLERQAEEAESRNAKLVTEGDIMVEDAGSYYAVTLPHISLEYPEGGRFEIGIIAINAIPGEDKTIKMTVALPTPMTAFNPDGEAVMAASIGRQNLSGIWHEDMRSFTKLKAKYSDIRMQSLEDSTAVLMPKAEAVINLEQNEGGNWSGPLTLDIRELQTFSETGEAVATFGHIGLNSSVFDYSLDTVMKHEDNMRALTESLQSGDSPSTSSQHITAIYKLVTDVMMNAWDGFENTITVSDMDINVPAKGNEPAEHVTLDQGGFSFDMTGFRDNNVAMRIAFSYEGLSVEPVPEDFSATTPTDMNFDFNITNVPFSEIVGLGETTIDAGTKNPQMAQMIGLQALMSIPQLITEAGTKLSIDNSYAGNESYNVLVNGALTADLKAALGATGESTIEVRGLETLIDAYKAQLDDPDITEAEEKVIKDNLKKISTLQLIGQQAEDDQGRAIRSYKFELGQDGKATLNGTNVQDIMGQIE